MDEMYTKEQVSSMMTNAMSGYDKGYDKGRARGKLDGFVTSLIGGAIGYAVLSACRHYYSKTTKEDDVQNEESVDATFEEI